MRVTCILGAQWGDEGKGKIAAKLAKVWTSASVSRCTAGPNAGHLVVDRGRRLVFRVLPASSLYGEHIILGAGLCIDIDLLIDEISKVKEIRPDVFERLRISGNAHVISRKHTEFDRVLSSGHIGTTGSGTGPCIYEKVRRSGVRIRDLAEAKFSLADYVTGITPHKKEVIETVFQCICDVPQFLIALPADSRVIVEGSQGALLDVEHGEYPFVTSTSTTVGGMISGLGISPRSIEHIWIVASSYLTKIGSGPFPTRIHGEVEKILQNGQQEIDGATGKLRDVGWIDLQHLRFARDVNGATGFFLTRIDILNNLPCFFALDADGRYKEFSSKERIQASFSIGDLSHLRPHVQEFLKWIEVMMGIPLVGVSWGPDTEELLLLRGFITQSD